MPADVSTNITVLLALLLGLWLLQVLKQRNKPQKLAIVSMSICAGLRVLYYIVLGLAGANTLITILINLISLATAMLLLYVFAVSLTILIVFKAKEAEDETDSNKRID